jgi:hypothetical protein
MKYISVAEPVYEMLIKEHTDAIIQAADEDTSFLDDIQDSAFALLIVGILSKIVESSKMLVRSLPSSQLTSISLNDRLHNVAQSAIAEKAIDIDGYIGQNYKSGKLDAFKKMDRSTFMGIADNHALSFLSNHSFDQITNLTHDLREKIRGEIWKGVRDGKSVEQVANRLSKIIKEPLEVTSKTTGKVLRTMSPENRAKLIARTEMHRAKMQGRLMAFENYGVEKIKIVNHGRNVCSRCIRNAKGNPYPIQEVPAVPTHPNCKCTYENASNPKESPRDNKSYYNLVTGAVSYVP